MLKHTEDLALEAGLITLEDDYSKLATDESREFFSQYTIQVGSTGNLGLSIGIASAAVGYESSCICLRMQSNGRRICCEAME